MTAFIVGIVVLLALFGLFILWSLLKASSDADDRAKAFTDIPPLGDNDGPGRGTPPRSP